MTATYFDRLKTNLFKIAHEHGFYKIPTDLVLAELLKHEEVSRHLEDRGVSNVSVLSELCEQSAFNSVDQYPEYKRPKSIDALTHDLKRKIDTFNKVKDPALYDIQDQEQAKSFYEHSLECYFDSSLEKILTNQQALKAAANEIPTALDFFTAIKSKSYLLILPDFIKELELKPIENDIENLKNTNNKPQKNDVLSPKEKLMGFIMSSPELTGAFEKVVSDAVTLGVENAFQESAKHDGFKKSEPKPSFWSNIKKHLGF